MNRVIKAFDELGRAVTKTLDLDGKPRVITDPNGNTTTFAYYAASKDGRLQKVTLPKVQSYATGRATQYDYDENGNVISVMDLPADGAPSRITTTTYDELNRPVLIVGPAVGGVSPVTCYTYSPLGFVPSACPAGGCRRSNVSFFDECAESNVGMTQVSMIFERIGLQQ